MAGQHMKLVTMELGGHAPAIVFEDADVEVALKILAANKFRNLWRRSQIRFACTRLEAAGKSPLTTRGFEAKC